MAKAGRPKADVAKEKYADSSEMTVTEAVQKGVSIIMEEKQTIIAAERVRRPGWYMTAVRE